MPNTDLQLTIGADVSAVSQGLAQFQSALTQATSQITGLRGAFNALASDVTALANNLSRLAEGLGSVGARGGQGLSALQQSSGGAATAIAGVTKNVGTLFKSAGAMGKALGAAGIVGGEALGAVGVGAGAAVDAVAAVGQTAQSAEDAMAGWAAATLSSNTASAEARRNAADLTNAIRDAKTAFGALGDTIANALAPVMTTIVRGLSDIAKGFVDSYNKGGLAKLIVDTLVGSLKGLVENVIDSTVKWIASFDTLKGAFASARAVWQMFADNFVDRAVEIGHQLSALGKLAFDGLTGNVQGAAQDMQSSLQTMQADSKKTADDLQRDIKAINDAYLRGGGAAADEAQAEAARLRAVLWGAPPVDAGPPSGHPPRAPGSLAGDSHPEPAPAPPAQNADQCPCDPSAAAACEQATQAARTTEASQGVAARAAAGIAGAAQIVAAAGEETNACNQQQASQVAAALDADRAKIASNNAANQQIAKSNDAVLKQFQSSMKGLVNNFARGLTQMVEGTKSFGQVMRSLGQQILDDFFRVVVGMVENWAWGETQKVLATAQGQALLNALGFKELAAEIANEQAKTVAVVTSVQVQNKAKQLGASQELQVSGTAAIKDITNSAAQAAGAAYKALAGIPIVGPLLGAAAATAAFGAVLVFKSLVASAAGGFDIPAGVNPLTQLHAQEMVLPARLANPMRDMLAGYGSASAPAASGHSFSFGDTHIHGAPNMSPSDFKQALSEHRSNVAEAVAGALRGGWRPSYKQPVGAL